jgi:hypothetical protein
LGGTAEGTTASEREVGESICAWSSGERWCGSECVRRRWVLCRFVEVSRGDALNLEQCVGEECLHLINLRFLGFSEEAKAGAKFGERRVVAVVFDGLCAGVRFELQGEACSRVLVCLISGPLIRTELTEFVGEQVQVTRGGSICVGGSSEVLEVGSGG